MALRQGRRAGRHLRRRDGPDEGTARASRRCAYRGRNAGPAARPSRTRRARPVGALARSSSTKPTRCSTWAFAKSSRKSSTPPPARAAPCCSRRPCRDRSGARQTLSEGRAADRDDRRGREPCRHRLSGVTVHADRHRTCGGQSAALPRGRDRDPLLRHPRCRAAASCQPDRARVLRRSRCRASIARSSATMRSRRCATSRARVCVATDVAARGHRSAFGSASSSMSNLPRDAEALAASFGPHRPRRAQGRRRADRADAPPPQRRSHAPRRAHRRTMDRRPAARRRFAAAIAPACSSN